MGARPGRSAKISGTVWEFAGPGEIQNENDYPLGKWINNARKRRSDGKLTEERIRQLDQLGMTWSVFDAKWEQGYALAAVYAQEYGNLDVPRDYKTADGKRLVAGFKIKN